MKLKNFNPLLSSQSPLLLLGVVLCFGFTVPKEMSASMKLSEVFRSVRSIKSLSYDFVREERIAGQMMTSEHAIKINRRPYKIYIKEVQPNIGVEVLFPHPLDESKALINPNGFPWVNLKLDPEGELMNKDQHHSILHGGFDYVTSVMEYAFYKNANRIDEMISREGTAEFNGRTCDIIRLSNSNFKYISYTVQAGETLSSIALKHHLSAFMIKEKNALGANELTAGDVIRLPSDYCAEMVMLVDQERHIPLVMEVFDESGLFEKYEFRNVFINPTLSQEEFDETFASYNF